MLFYLSTYIYPLSESLVLSESLNITLDNPRTEEEIAYIERYVNVSMDSPDQMYEHDAQFRIPLESDEGMMSVSDCVGKFYQNHTHDPVVQGFKALNENLPLLSQISRMWVIVRFSDDGELEDLNRIRDKFQSEGAYGVVLLDENNPIEVNSSNLVNYAHLLSLFLTSGKDYFGESFLLHEHYWELDTPRVDPKLNMNILYFGFCSAAPKQDDDSKWRISLPSVIENIKMQSVTIENSITSSAEAKEKILYVASLLKISSCDISDEKYKLVTYVGILELLLTHNPDFMRFNVEDSINKQFQLKVATLVYLVNNRSIPVGEIKAKLKIIYQQRSNIAHGNFKALKKYTDSLSKKDGEEEYFEGLISDTIFYVRSVLGEYINDVEFVEFLRKS